MAGVAIALLCGMYLEEEQAALTEQVIRLHVIANSDTPEDQQLKLAVRDRVLECAAQLYQPGNDLEQVRQNIEENLHRMAAVGYDAVQEQGYDYAVSASLERTWFPTKTYSDFALPAGYYTALRIVIGEGNGQNWWCVAFPPLCVGSASRTVEEVAAAGLFRSDDAALITGENQGYVIKFKALEWWAMLKKIMG